MNINLTLRQLRAFDAVSESGSFTKAAQRLHLTQSALSVLVREMERELGVPLFDRHTRRVELAEAGRDLLPYVKRVLNELEQAVHSVTELRDQHKGVLRIAATQLIACTLIPKVLTLYRQRHPGVEVRFQDALPEHLLDRVQAGEVELGVGPDSAIDPQALQQLSVLRERHWLIARADHPLASCRRVRWQDLAGQTFIAPTRDFVSHLQAGLGPLSAPLLQQPCHEVSYFTTAFGLVAAGLGVTLCPTYAAALVKGYGLQMIDMPGPHFHREVRVYSQAGKRHSPAAAGFVDCLQECVRQGF